jgi:pantothenate kinase
MSELVLGNGAVVPVDAGERTRVFVGTMGSIGAERQMTAREVADLISRSSESPGATVQSKDGVIVGRDTSPVVRVMVPRPGRPPVPRVVHEVRE